jgi:hypothetical protein
LERRTESLIDRLEVVIDVKPENCLQTKYAVLKKVTEVIITKEVEVTTVVVIVGIVCQVNYIVKKLIKHLHNVFMMIT